MLAAGVVEPAEPQGRSGGLRGRADPVRVRWSWSLRNQVRAQHEHQEGLSAKAGG